MVAPTVEGRLLCVSEVAYFATKAGPIVRSTAMPYYDGPGFLEPPMAIVDGPQAIDACIVGRTSDGIVVGFRGTQPFDDPSKPFAQRLDDWCQDFRADLVTSAGLPGKVHAGFMAAVNALWGDLTKEIRRQLSTAPAGAALYFTGHSKGGAMAPLAAMKWVSEADAPKPTLVTFAAARPANDDFALAFGKTIPDMKRYEYGNDIVPHLPPHITLIPVLSAACKKAYDDKHDYEYQSVGQLFYIDSTGKFETPVSGSLEDHALRMKRLGWLAEALLEGDVGEIVKEHSIDCGSGYQRAICPTGVC
jgi:Lipase (class 3)